MKKTSNKKKVAIILVVGILYASYILIYQQIQMFKCNRQIKDNNKVIAQLELDAKKLAKTQQEYQSDEFKEKIAREKLGYVKPGEKIYIDQNVNK